MTDPQHSTNGAPSPRAALGMCHRCIAGMLGRLEALAAELAAAGPGTPPPGQADRARSLVAEIDEALRVHVADEEADIFPALLAACEAPARRAQAFELVSTLLVEHRELAELWHALRIPLLALGSGVAVAFPGGTAADFLLRMRSHLEREDLELADLLGVIDASRSRTIAMSITHRHEEACPRVPRCPMGKGER
jgi:hypothetical protein